MIDKSASGTDIIVSLDFRNLSIYLSIYLILYIHRPVKRKKVLDEKADERLRVPLI